MKGQWTGNDKATCSVLWWSKVLLKDFVGVPNPGFGKLTLEVGSF